MGFFFFQLNNTGFGERSYNSDSTWGHAISGQSKQVAEAALESKSVWLWSSFYYIHRSALSHWIFKALFLSIAKLKSFAETSFLQGACCSKRRVHISSKEEQLLARSSLIGHQLSSWQCTQQLGQEASFFLLWNHLKSRSHTWIPRVLDTGGLEEVFFFFLLNWSKTSLHLLPTPAVTQNHKMSVLKQQNSIFPLKSEINGICNL